MAVEDDLTFEALVREFTAETSTAECANFNDRI